MSSQTELKTSKFSGLGNEILLVDLIRQSGHVDSDLVKKIVLTHQVQFDQLISIEAPSLPNLDFSATIFNRDGSKAENCINGARCFGKYIFDTGLLNKPELLVGVEENTWKISNSEKNMYAVEQEISDPSLGEEMLPKINSSGLHSLDLGGDNLEIGFVNLGNPHAIHFNTEIKAMPLDKWGKIIQESKHFPDGVNLTLAEMISPKEVNVRVFERGVGETLACGSGACATVIKGVQLGYLEKEAIVNFKTGCLSIKYDSDNQVLTATGPADFLEETNILI
tara:strand:+ start:767 stop:1606 length:840 start_codon:yes stop_codon:yes gene_type:complete